MDSNDPVNSLSGRSGLRLGIMGGAFDPIHLAHLVAADEAMAQFELDEVVFMPTGGHPHKGPQPAAAEFRYLLASVATASNPRFSVSRYEVDKQGTAYTADTLEFLAAHLAPDTQLFFITGADALLDLLTWKDPEKVLVLSTLVAANRPGYDLSGLRDVLAKLMERHGDAGLQDRVKLFDIPSLDISSSMIRQRLRLGRPVRYLLPDGVAELVEKSNHYREAAPRAGGEEE